MMLAVRRASVTDALSALRVRKLITATRGVITVLDRKGSSVMPEPSTASRRENTGVWWLKPGRTDERRQIERAGAHSTITEPSSSACVTPI